MSEATILDAASLRPEGEDFICFPGLAERKRCPLRHSYSKPIKAFTVISTGSSRKYRIIEHLNSVVKFIKKDKIECYSPGLGLKFGFFIANSAKLGHLSLINAHVTVCRGISQLKSILEPVRNPG